MLAVTLCPVFQIQYYELYRFFLKKQIKQTFLEVLINTNIVYKSLLVWYNLGIMKNLISKLFEELNIVAQCRKFKVPLYQCPTCLFIVMGVVVVMAILTSYYLAKNYGFDPEIQAFLALVVAGITFTIGSFVVQGFAKLAEASLLKSQFLNIISHQLLTPLSSLKWALNLFSATSIKITEKEKEELLSVVNQSNENMINIVNSLLDVSRLDVGKIKLNKEEVDLIDLVKDVVRGREHDMETKKIDLKLELEENLPFVYTDRARTRVVINNLIDNAVKFSRLNSEIIINVYSDRNDIIFSIEDFGVGISKEQRKHLYSKFFRADSPIKYQTKGFGLGLFAAKFIVNALGGEMNFKSEENVGSRFWFSLPIYKN